MFFVVCIDKNRTLYTLQSDLQLQMPLFGIIAETNIFLSFENNDNYSLGNCTIDGGQG